MIQKTQNNKKKSKTAINITTMCLLTAFGVAKLSQERPKCSVMKAKDTSLSGKLLETKTTTRKPIREEKGFWYTVREGDTLWSIAESLLKDPLQYTAIMKVNRLKSDVIKPYQHLYILPETRANSKNKTQVRKMR